MTLMQHRPDTTPAFTAAAATGSAHTGSARTDGTPAGFVLASHAINRTIPGTLATMRAGDRFLHGSPLHVIEIEILDDQVEPGFINGQPCGTRRVRRCDTDAVTTYRFQGEGPCAQALVCPEHGGALGMKPGCFTCAPVIA